MATRHDPVHDHDHNDRTGAALTAAAQRALIGGGEQWTAMRAAVFSALTSFNKPASAYDVTDAVSAAQGRRVAANSVYRILDLFVANNVAMVRLPVLKRLRLTLIVLTNNLL